MMQNIKNHVPWQWVQEKARADFYALQFKSFSILNTHFIDYCSILY